MLLTRPLAQGGGPPTKKPYELKGTNGFMITFDISSADVAQATGAPKGY